MTRSPVPSAAPATGRDARLHGVNLGGWLVAGASAGARQTFAGAADFARLASWRFTHARIPVDDALLDTAEGWPALDRALTDCLDAGLRCVLALRLPPGEQEGLFGTTAGWGRLVRRWEAIAGRYAAAPEPLLFDLLDRPAAPDTLPPEALDALGTVRLSAAAARRPAAPGATGGRAWNALALRLTRAVRAVDERHTLIVAANGADPRAFAHLRPTRDPNTVYGFHCFEPRAFTEQGAAEGPATQSTPPVGYPGTVGGERWDRSRMEALLGPVAEFRRVYDAPVYCAAFGAAAGAPRSGRLTWLRTVLSICRAGGAGWAYWTYRGGPFALAGPQGVDYDVLGVLQSES